MRRFFMRVFQRVSAIVLYFLPWREPVVYKGAGMLNMVPVALKTADINRVVVVTDQGIKNSGLLDKVIEQLDESSISYDIYDQVEPNPDEATIQEIADMYKKNDGQGLIGVGGGSVIDATKVAAILVNNPGKQPRDFEGLLKVRRKTAYNLMIPTTAGTGSEVTLAAVVSNPSERRKYTIMEPKIIPNAAILAPEMLVSLPAKLTAETGMDALTHAVESFISRTRTKQTKHDGVKAVKLISDYLKRSYDAPDDVAARLGMLEASYYAGRAFTRAYVGNIHAMSHALTAFYDSPHGRTNALVMPIVLRMYGEPVHKALAELADEVSLTNVDATNEEKATAFIEWIEGLNETFGIPKHIPDIKHDDLDALIAHAYKEANPMYPVPVIFSREDFREGYLRVKR